jgi:hypothetical protein
MTPMRGYKHFRRRLPAAAAVSVGCTREPRKRPTTSATAGLHADLLFRKPSFRCAEAYLESIERRRASTNAVAGTLTLLRGLSMVR